MTAQNLALRYTGAAEMAVAPISKSLEITGDLTVEAWVRPDAETDNFLNFVLSNNLDGRGWTLELGRDGDSKYPIFRVEGESNNAATDFQPLALGEWTHLAGRWQNGVAELYRDGRLVASAPSPQLPRLSELTLFVGSSPFQLETFLRGDLDEVKVWNGARSHLEIIESMLGREPSGDEASGAQLVAHWTFDDASAGAALDSSGSGNHLVLGLFDQPAPSRVPSAVPIDGNGALPVAAIASSALEVVAGETVRFYDASRGAPDAWFWDFGDGETSTTRNPTHRFDQAGSHQVRLTSGSGSRARTSEITVVVLAAVEPSYPSNRALRYSGKGELAAVPESSHLLSPAGPFTAEAWVWSDFANVAPLTFVLSKNLFFSGWALFTVESTFGRLPVFEINTTPPDSHYAPVGSEMPQGVWIHLAGTWDAGVMRVFVDGHEVAQIEAPVPATPSETPLFIGSSLFGAGTYWIGAIDEVRVWNRARSGAEILSTMNTSLSGDEPGLVGYWTFDEGAGVVAQDSAGSSDAFLGVASGFAGVIPPRWVPSDAPVCCGGATVVTVSEETVLGGAGAPPALAVNRRGLAAVAFSEGTGVSLMLLDPPAQTGNAPVARAELFLPDQEASALRVALNEDGDAALLSLQPEGPSPVVLFEAPEYQPVVLAELGAGLDEADLAFSSEGLVVASRDAVPASTAGSSFAAAASIVGRMFRPGAPVQNLGALTPTNTAGSFDLQSTANGGLYLAWLGSPSGNSARPGELSAAATSSQSVVGRSFTPGGQPSGSSTTLGAGDATSQVGAASGSDGGTVVTWQTPKDSAQTDPEQQQTSLIVRVVTPQGTLGTTREVAVSAPGEAIESPSLSTSGSGGSVVTWSSRSARESGIRGVALDGSLAAKNDFAVVRDRSLAQSSAVVGNDVLVAYQGERLAVAEQGDDTPRTADRTSARLVSLGETCSADSLCLSGGRFAVRASWEAAGGQSGIANPAELTGDTGYFWFFDAANVEVVIKVLEGCPLNDRFWVFAAGLTDVAVTLTVDDTLTGQTKVYTNPAGNAFAPIQDTEAFATCDAAGGGVAQAIGDAASSGSRLQRRAASATAELSRLLGGSPPSTSLVPAAASSGAQCVSDDETLCLRGGRFEVRTAFATAQGSSGAAQRVPLTADTGYFSFFDPSNVEVVIKVLDGCAINGQFWVFAAGLTDTNVLLVVRDTVSGQVRQYESPLGSAFQPVQDTSAFATCP